MYEAQKQLFEENLVKSELEPTPGGWWLDFGGDNQWVAKNGKCCALSPSLLGRKWDAERDAQLAFAYCVSLTWVLGALDGFDNPLKPVGPESVQLEFFGGFAWGQEMRRKYVRAAA